MQSRSHPDRIRALLERRQWDELRRSLEVRPAPDVADLLRTLDRAERALVFRALPRPAAARVFAELLASEQDVLLANLTDRETGRLLASLPPDERSGLLGELPSPVIRRLLSLLAPAERAEARGLLGYPERSVGWLMSPEYVAVDPESTVQDTLAYLRRFDADSETLDRILVVDRRGELIAEVPLRRLLFAAPTEPVHRIAERAVISVSASAHRGEAAHLVDRYDLATLPVVDSQGHLLGVVTRDDLADAAGVEVGEDTARRTGIPAEADPIGRWLRILQRPAPRDVTLQVPWLLVGLVGGLIIALIICSLVPG